ncbi:hypothetical protein WG219_11330 [Ectopseudomonas mendocina]|uniref:Uncharacterized protein n=1 Tax=Ectopseudomonas mendocina TaxID=300 RepID=A0ABZ2RBG0_ECTME
MSTSDWQKAKAAELVEYYVEQIKRSEFPEPNLCQGMIEMAYATALLDDEQYGYWTRLTELAVQERRAELRKIRGARIRTKKPQANKNNAIRRAS